MLATCTREPADHSVAHRDQAYSHGPDRFVWCAFGIDTKPQRHPRLDEITDALKRAKLEGTTLHLFAHVPGGTIDTSSLEHVLAAAADLGVQLTTYDQLNAREIPGTLALSFDDSDLASWTSIRPMLLQYHAHVTFFVTYFLGFTDPQREQLHRLAADGHDIEYHSTSHLDAVKFTAEHGIAEYIATDIVPGLDAMRAAGYATRTFAYPYGSRTAAIDDALRPYFDHVRGVGKRCP
ncbi:MAG TPA: polysaccharide deacetylase family protein [Kofleriaceae bacterium]|nr:polysaccharide deacetylase family protein [Kofleriaceae bacterium]